MKRSLLLPLTSLLAVAACSEPTSTPVERTAIKPSLSSVHLKGGANAKPSFTDLILQLQATGALSGLGAGDVFVGLTATANATATCTNPGSGGTQPPGQNPAPVTVSGGQAIPASELKNGNTPFDVTTQRPVTPIPGAPGCPNTQWTEDITDLSFTTATITVQQPQDVNPAANIVLTVRCTFAPATANGAVLGNRVSCQ